MFLQLSSTRYAEYRQNGEPDNVKVFWSNTIKGPKQNSQHQIRAPMPEGGEPKF